MNQYDILELESLPDEILVQVLDDLPIGALLNVMQTSKSIRNHFYPEFEDKILFAQKEQQKEQRKQQFFARVINLNESGNGLSLKGLLTKIIRAYDIPVSAMTVMTKLHPFYKEAQSLNKGLDQDIYLLNKFLDMYDIDIDPNLNINFTIEDLQSTIRF